MSKHQLAGSLSKKTLTLEGKIKLLDSEATTGGIYKISQNSQENTRAISFLINKLQTAPATLLKKRPWHRCFHVNFGKFLRTPFLQNTSGRVLLLIPTKKRKQSCEQLAEQYNIGMKAAAKLIKRWASIRKEYELFKGNLQRNKKR